MYDVIICGARVAGSATALLLARAGLRVLVLDRASFPSDTLSTHNIQYPGVSRLAQWGLLDRIAAAGTPPIRRVSLDTGDVTLTGTVPALYSPRRTLLDSVLVNAARAAGAEVRENFAVEELSTCDGTVTGVHGREKGGPPVAEGARLVMGADGKRSLVARSVRAREYRQRPVRTMAYYTYFSGVPLDGARMYSRPGAAVGLWPTGDGLTMAYVARPVDRFAEFRRDVDANFMSTVDGTPAGPLLRAGQRAERYRGSPDLPNTFRVPYGPGWALVGDAGLVLDPITGQGIGDALRDAELLAAAIVDGALPGYRRARDRAALGMYNFTQQLAALAEPTAGERGLFRALAADPAASDRFFAMLCGALLVSEFMAPAAVVKLVGLRGLVRLMRRR